VIPERTMNIRTFSAIVFFSSLVPACAAAIPPKELIEARTTYTSAVNGPTAQTVPADVENARKALADAERAFEDEPNAQKTKDAAYVAHRKALLAVSKGHIAVNEKAVAAADLAFRDTATSTIDQQKAALGAEKQNSSRTAQALAAETLARQQAEKRAKDAMDRLSALAAIKQDTRGIVITLSGSVLFATDKSDLLPTAHERLNQVADALKEQPERALTVYGYTDSQGKDDYNIALSQRRAESVRSYLVGRGVETDRIKAVGKGKDEPVADNKNAEGRANNRRVEIVVANPK